MEEGRNQLKISATLPLIKTFSMRPLLACTATKIQCMSFFSVNCAVSVTISTFMCLWAIYIFPWSVHIFSFNRIVSLILEIYNLSQIYECKNWKTEHYNSVLEITVSLLRIHKWEPDIYIGFSPALHLQCDPSRWTVPLKHWKKDD